jgi:hypothetical protein
MLLEIRPLRFTFRASGRVAFRIGSAANIFRGALGYALRETGCPPSCPSAAQCPFARDCAYGRIFEPTPAAEGPSGFAQPPRPFVLRTRHLDGQAFEAGETFDVDMNLFDIRPQLVSDLTTAWTNLAQVGIGAERTPVSLLRFGQRNEREELQELLTNETLPSPLRLSLLSPASSKELRIRVRFLSPTELKREGTSVAQPDFPILFARIRDRIGALMWRYGQDQLTVDHRQLGQRAAKISSENMNLEQATTTRRSSRTGQVHSLGGFTGTAEYRGALDEFLPYLRAAQWTGVGRQTVWGKGEIRLEAVEDAALETLR